MYLRAKVVATADGSPIETGVVAYHLAGKVRAAAVGDPAEHVANGIWAYEPTAGEIAYAEYGIEFYHADAVGKGPVVNVINPLLVTSEGKSIYTGQC
jgi:glycerate kinase